MNSLAKSDLLSNFTSGHDSITRGGLRLASSNGCAMLTECICCTAVSRRGDASGPVQGLIAGRQIVDETLLPCDADT